MSHLAAKILSPYKIQMNYSKVAGVDIGGSHITAAVVDLEKRAVISRTVVRKRINSHADADEIMFEWAETIRRVFGSAPGASKNLGIAIPGPFDYEKGTCLIKGLDKYESLYGLNVKQLLAQKLG